MSPAVTGNKGFLKMNKNMMVKDVEDPVEYANQPAGPSNISDTRFLISLRIKAAWQQDSKLLKACSVPCCRHHKTAMEELFFENLMLQKHTKARIQLAERWRLYPASSVWICWCYFELRLQALHANV